MLVISDPAITPEYEIIVKQFDFAVFNRVGTFI